MATDKAARSDFLIHWTGSDIDRAYDPCWYETVLPSSEMRADSPAAKPYASRLLNILRFGLWLTAEEDVQSVKVGRTEVAFPATPKVCFTELKLSDSRHHARRYGRLGIGFKRPYLFSRGGRPLAYFKSEAGINNDPFFEACATELTNKNLLNYFKPMNDTVTDLTYKYYYESEWRILFAEELLKSRKVIDPRDPVNEKEHDFFTSLTEPEQKKLRYLVPVDGWLSMIIYPSFWIKNMVKSDPAGEVDAEIRRIKEKRPDEGNECEEGNWPIEVDLPAIRHF